MATVYFQPVTNNKSEVVSKIARKLLEKLVSENNIKLEKEIPIKVHVGEPGNISYIKPENYNGIIDCLKEKKINTYFVETVTVTGPRNTAIKHAKVVWEHGFVQIPFLIADGEEGNYHVDVPIVWGNHFKSAKIAVKLANKFQVLVASHFKGHIASGFGGAIKMLGIGFASRVGKMEQHSKNFSLKQKTIHWQNDELYRGKIFRERTAEYALAAAKGKKHLYLTFALNLVSDCDCDGRAMKPLYDDLGIFASTDPVAIDKACFDLLKKREGKQPFGGEDIFPYAEKIGLGMQKYDLIKIN